LNVVFEQSPEDKKKMDFTIYTGDSTRGFQNSPNTAKKAFGFIPNLEGFVLKTCVIEGWYGFMGSSARQAFSPIDSKWFILAGELRK